MPACGRQVLSLISLSQNYCGLCDNKHINNNYHLLKSLEVVSKINIMINIFIVDDHEIIREGLKRILEAEHDMRIVGETNNGNDVVSGISETECDILLLDLNIPGRQGAALINDIQKKKPKVRILILSIVPEDKFVLPLLRAGAMGYISKSSDLRELVFAIRKIYDNGRYLNGNLTEQLAFDVLTENVKLPRKLSNLENNILLLIARGKQYPEIAEELAISLGSIAICRRRILEKLSLKNNVELTYYALKNNLVKN